MSETGQPGTTPTAGEPDASSRGGLGLRTDLLVGLATLAVGGAVLLGSGNLPIGSLSAPGAGFLPRVIAIACLVVGALLLVWSAQSRRLVDVDWHDTPHAIGVMAICIAASVLLEQLGFVATMALLIFALVRGLDKRPTLFALLFTIAVVGAIYLLLGVVFGAQLPGGNVWTRFR